MQKLEFRSLGCPALALPRQFGRTFRKANPDKTTYFQPVLDRLQVVPSRLDFLRPSVVVEGKGDYLILALGLMLTDKKGDYAIIPTRGADHFDELIGILLGWGVNFSLCCDDDTKGRRAAAEFVDEWGLSRERVFTLVDFDPALQGKRIEDLLEPADRQLVAAHFGLTGNPSKSQIQLFFSEKLAVKERVGLSTAFITRIGAFDAKVRAALGIKLPSSAPPKKATVRKK